MFEIWCRNSNSGEWRFYGRFASETEWQKEKAHVAFLQEVGPLYLELALPPSLPTADSRKRYRP
jgi:hypothetical protein